MRLAPPRAEADRRPAPAPHERQARRHLLGLDLTRYQAALDYLFARATGKTKFGLGRTEALLGLLEDPHRSLPVFHVAGTNGKGSVCATLDALLTARGYRVARYTSPHLVDFRERVLVGGRPVSEDAVVDFIERWTPEVERLGATFFEATTAMAFSLFREAGADVAVIETGLGGRLDSTNVVDPLAATVVTIGIDHVEFLGATREEIAWEKAGIFKRGRPAVIGEPAADVRALLANHATEHGAMPVRLVFEESPPREVRTSPDGTAFTMRLGGDERRLRTALVGDHQAGNAATALLTLDAAGEEWRAPLELAERVLPGVRLPGRFQRSGRYLFDVAHNPDGAAVLARTLATTVPERPVVLLLSVLRDKDWRGILRALAPVVDRVVLTNAPTAPASRAWNLDEVERFAREHGIDVRAEADFERALVETEDAGTVLVTGSFHTVGDAMARLQVDPLAG